MPLLHLYQRHARQPATGSKPIGFPTALLFLIVFLFLAGTSALGQSSQGGLRGKVADADSRPLSGVTLTLTNLATNASRNTVTNQAGEYAFDLIEPGQYKLSAELSGFKKLDRSGLIIEVKQQLTLDLSLDVGDVSDVVTVSGEIPLLETSNGSTGTVLSKQALDNLPVAGRSPFFLTSIAPNVAFVGNPTFNRQQDQTGSSTVSIAGGPVRGNNYLLEGVPISDLGNRAVVIPTIEAVNEVKLQTTTYDAEAGRTGGGVFNVTGRAGSNEFHGGIFGFNRPSALRANNFFANRAGIRRPDTSYYLYGGSFGGPVKIPGVYNGKDRTFFWTAFEGYRQQSFQTQTFTVPSLLERNGDFSQTRVLVNGVPTAITVFDPRSGTSLGNVIPANRLDPVGLALLRSFPLPTGPGDAAGRNNYTATSVFNDRADQVTARIDHAFTDRLKVNGTYVHYGSREPVADYYKTISNPGGSLLLRKVNLVAANALYTLNPSTVLNVRYGFNNFGDNVETASAGFDPATLGFSPNFTNGIAFRKFPRVTFVGGAYGSDQGGLGSTAPVDRTWYSHNLIVALSKLVGRHSLKFGADYRRLALDFNQIGQASGEFSFSRAFTQNPASTATTGNELASLALGYFADGSAQIVRPLGLFTNYYGFYAQDDFRVTPKLTLNLGLRYEYEQGFQERNNQLTVGFDPNVAATLGTVPVRGGLIFAGVGGNPTQQINPSKTRFAPRLGFAYAINERTTVRGGYALFWAPPIFTAAPTAGGVGALGFIAPNTISNLATSGSTLFNPFPAGLSQPTGSSLGPLTQVGFDIEYVDPTRKAAYLQQYSLEFQRELPGNVVVSAGYVGSVGRQLQIGGTLNSAININQLTPAQLALGSSFLNQQVPNPFFGQIGTPLFRNPTISRAQLLRPFPQFGNILQRGTGGGKSSYNALTLKAQKRLSRGYSLLASYTWSKTLDNVIGQNNFFAQSSGIVNSYDLNAEYGLSSIDIAHRAVISGTVELPFGNGRRFFSTGRKADLLLGGWSVSAIATIQGGYPLTVTQAITPGNAPYLLGQRPNVVAGVAPGTSGAPSSRIGLDSGSVRYLNPAAFTTAPGFTIGNASRTIGVRSPGTANLDVSIIKDTTIFENFKAQFRFEAINALNTPVFNAPNTTVGSASFGQITSQANFPRVVQLSLRLLF